MSAPADLATPQMECPTCRATVRITGRGTIAQHTRRVLPQGRYPSITRRCPASWQPAPDGAHAAWLRAMLDDEFVTVARWRALAHDARAAAVAHEEAVRKHAARADEVAAALAAIGATP